MRVVLNSFIRATLGHCSTLQERHDTGRTKKFKVHTPAIIIAHKPPTLLSFVIIRSTKLKVRTVENQRRPRRRKTVALTVKINIQRMEIRSSRSQKSVRCVSFLTPPHELPRLWEWFALLFTFRWWWDSKELGAHEACMVLDQVASRNGGQSSTPWC